MALTMETLWRCAGFRSLLYRDSLEDKIHQDLIQNFESFDKNSQGLGARRQSDPQRDDKHARCFFTKRYSNMANVTNIPGTFLANNIQTRQA